MIPEDFAVFNALLAIFTLVSTPMGTLQTAVVKFTADFNSRKEFDKIRALLSGILKAVFFAAAGIMLVFWLGSGYLIRELKIPSVLSWYMLAFMVFVSFLAPVFLGSAQGLEFFGWYVSASLVSSILKLTLVFLFTLWGWGINGALGAFTLAVLSLTLIAFIPVRKFIILRRSVVRIQYGEFSLYFIPVAVSLFCFSGLVNFDMILVKKYFLPAESGVYSLAQMVGKIFLFLPSAISVVLFPRTAGLNAVNRDTRGTLRHSLALALLLCASACVFYNIFPGFVLKILVGKVSPETVMLGRLFSLSMSLFALGNIMISYFLSLGNARFIKYLVLSALAQYLLIVFFHGSLQIVQRIMCVNAAVLLGVFCLLAFRRQENA